MGGNLPAQALKSLWAILLDLACRKFESGLVFGGVRDPLDHHGGGARHGAPPLPPEDPLPLEIPANCASFSDE
jgi:hypothetical protein